MGTAANLMIQPWGAILIGVVAGVLSTFGYKVIQVNYDERGLYFISIHSKYIILIESSFVRNIDGSCCHCGSIDLLLRNALGILSKLGVLEAII